MSDENKTPVDDVTEPQETSEDAVNEETGEQEVTETETQTKEDAEEPKWKTRHRSPEAVFAENSRLQSELDKTRAELKSKGIETVPSKKSPDDLLREFAVDPQGFIERAVAAKVAPIAGNQYLNDFLSDQQNAKRFGPYKELFREKYGGNPVAIADPNVMKAVFLLLEDEVKSVKLQVGGQKIAEHRDNVTQTKKGQAFVESSTKSAPKTVSNVIKPGMSTAEMDKILDSQGVPIEENY